MNAQSHQTGEQVAYVPERRMSDAKIHAMVDSVNQRLDDGDERMTRIEAKLDDNSSDTAEMLDIIRLGKSFFRIIGGIGTFVKWAAAIAAPLVAIWYTIKNGGKP